MILPSRDAIPDRMTAATPLFSFNVDKGSVKFRESYRKVLSDGTAHAPPASVSATIELKPGEYTFQIAFDSPAPRDITLTFGRLAGVEWDTPLHKHERIAESYFNNLIVTQHLAEWVKVHEIQAILRGGQDCQHLPIDELLRCCKTHEKPDPATAFLGRYRKAPRRPIGQVSASGRVPSSEPMTERSLWWSRTTSHLRLRICLVSLAAASVASSCP